ncbi:unnamed protein product [Didymodactylos carnosus]|uniref:Mutator-like transposase domain-containing protein n=1 Tax=Didymodactylos carnosus TaxID=1234261 RepID=A0A814ZH99_9BILA|nr:unnamed protein product [Didymodactylos carnosus]CAF1245347.1 unnamed protein product [Didymodactylos carnosus]CAF3918397.1 unnamed protein product [Didymodactylos carnosus]CAF4011038.1 unnamed protein product [Didymodactylos carnosus]
MGKSSICHKTESRRSIIKQIRSENLNRKRGYSSSSDINKESTNSVQNQFTSSIENIEDGMDFYLIIHLNSLISLLQQFLCSERNNLWDESVSIKEQNGLYMQLEFKCHSCGFLTRLCSSPQVPNSRRHDINVRLAIGGTLCGLGRNGLMKLLGALSLPPPVQEQKYREAQELILNSVENAQEQSTIAAVEEAVVEAGGVRNLTISGDGV